MTAVVQAPTHRAGVVQGTVYLLGIIDPATGEHVRVATGQTVTFWHAGHYTGYAEPGRLNQRLAEQLAGKANAAKLVRAVIRAGLAWKLIDTWPGDRWDERRRKNWHGAGKYCRECRAARGTRRAPAAAAATPPAPAGAVVFLRLNPSFARPARASAEAQYSRARAREECAALGPLVIRATVEENHPHMQRRAHVVLGRIRRARALAYRQLAEQRANRDRFRRLATVHLTRGHTTPATAVGAAASICGRAR